MQSTNTDFKNTIDRALQASRINDSATAIAQFQEAAKLDPNSALPHFLLGAEYIENKQIAEAETAYANAILLAPQLYIARFQLGLLFLTTERQSMALITWEPLLSLPPENALRLFVEGFVAAITNDFPRAIQLVQEGITNNKDNMPLNLDMSNLINRWQAQLADNAPSVEETPKIGVTPAPSSEIAEPEKNAFAASDDEINQFLISIYTQNRPLH